MGEYLFALPFFHIWTRFIEATDAVGETQSLSHYIEDIYDKLSLKLSLFEDEDDQKWFYLKIAHFLDLLSWNQAPFTVSIVWNIWQLFHLDFLYLFS